MRDQSILAEARAAFGVFGSDVELTSPIWGQLILLCLEVANARPRKKKNMPVLPPGRPASMTQSELCAIRMEVHMKRLQQPGLSERKAFEAIARRQLMAAKQRNPTLKQVRAEAAALRSRVQRHFPKTQTIGDIFRTR